ncbi:tRNA synthetase subunit beta [Weissella oryzae SG25]|uniref:tRNA synthetase subunit beta n=1 Tax=Weissella oryzae (strain DSM 25784 / JCM 18191 / LMG 30913 / SG25) TaxID=1329250 RepID=A0A069CUH8_WEIOS|nr:phenylalanine--tRNA ligase beta subunit-related protein [Weissella oryzae]GAK30868.1 tRNA synthetase subunit beta [Weissella oryzae SG25]
MKNVTVDDEFWALFPEATINLLVLKDIKNEVDPSKDAHFAGLLAEAQKTAKTFLTEDVFSQNQVIAEWRAAYTKFKTKKGARSSIEALLKRIDQGKLLGTINPLVDIYNSISLSFALPAGGEDIDKLDGDLHLGVAQGGESFLPLGAEADEPALPGEVIYYDNSGAVCRCFNWREAQRTMLTEDTKNVVLVLEALNEEQQTRAQAALVALQAAALSEFGTTGDAHRITIEAKTTTL